MDVAVRAVALRSLINCMLYTYGEIVLINEKVMFTVVTV